MAVEKRNKEMVVVDKIKEFWHDQIPGWLPIFLAVLSAAFWIGQKQQNIEDRLVNLEKQVMAIQNYLRSDHGPKGFVSPPPISELQSQQQAGADHP